MNKKRITAIISGSVALLILIGAIISACVFGWFGIGKKNIGTHTSKNDIKLENNNTSEILNGSENISSTIYSNKSYSNIKVSDFNNMSIEQIVDELNKNGNMPRFKSYDEFVSKIRTLNTGVSYKGTYSTTAGVAKGTAENKAAANSTADQAYDYSSTNTQVSGIDEADIIRNDGKYIYIAAYNKIEITDAYPAKLMKKVATITFDRNENACEMYLKGKLLVVLGAKYENTVGNTTVSSAEKSNIMVDYLYSNGNRIFVKIYDVSDINKIILKRKIEIDGCLISSREKNGRFYIITNKYIYNCTDENIKSKAILPSYFDSNKGTKDIIINAQNIGYCPDEISSNYLLVSVFDINNNEPLKVETVLGAGNNVYMSNENLYVAKAFYKYQRNSGSETTSGKKANTSAAANAPTFQVLNGTYIIKFSLTDKGVVFSKAGSVQGQILNQYSMDEYNGHFRIATTNLNRSVQTNNLYVLGSDMKIKGKLENLAKGERIYAVRFSEKTAYIVTYRNTDPLFIIDLSNPATPTVKGELKIPGFSNYLHPIGNNLMIGIGQLTFETYSKDENGNAIVTGVKRSGVKLSLFDVSNPQQPKELDNVVMGGVGSYSEVQNNPKAFLWWGSKSAAILPVYLIGEDGSTQYGSNKSRQGLVVIHVKDKKLVVKAKLLDNIDTDNQCNYYINRAVYMDDTLYKVLNNTITAYDINNMSKIGSIIMN